MNIKFNDEESTILNLSEVPILILNDEKIEFRLDKWHAVFNIDFIDRDLAKKDFDRLKEILEPRGFILIGNTLLSKEKIVAVSANQRRCSLIVLLDNGAFHEIKFENGYDTKDGYDKLFADINKYNIFIRL